VTIEKLQAHYGFTKMPFRRDVAPGMLHRHAAHAEAAARISWCISEHALGVITGEVGAGKTVALRAALASLDPSRHTLIYLGNPSVGVRGINHAIVAALGGVPKTHHATLTPQAMDLLAREHAERGRIPVLAIDEAHMLEPGQLEAVRMLTLCRDRDYAGGRQGSPGDRVRACQASGIIPGPRGTRGACRAGGTCLSSSSAARSGPGPSP
jgi:type II secretory pathway predicted ATPase ExeA